MDFKGSETEANLRRAFTAEAHTRGKYALYAEAARREGWEQPAAKFEGAAQAERAREVRFQKLLENHKGDRVFQKEAPALWRCRNCGRPEFGKRAPASCPVCGRPQGFFQVRAEKY